MFPAMVGPLGEVCAAPKENTLKGIRVPDLWVSSVFFLGKSLILIEQTLYKMCEQFLRALIWWISSQCGITGNECVDSSYVLRLIIMLFDWCYKLL